ncbi:hypothetical protein BBJ28_00024548 [Nothophytophthora sp. Chile5]|nr:hypothetical protein BBJ28_00024548 [Nothophytophthora sp. Chile5]
MMMHTATAVTVQDTNQKLCGFKRQLSEPSSPTTFRCTEAGCDRAFNRKYTLVEHLKTHTGERPHLCPVRTCGKRFSTSGNLSRHKRLHGYIEPLQCPVQGCICTFPSNNKLEKHMKFHYGGAVKVCSVPGCGKTFSTTGNLNRHLKNHHGELEAAAAVCDSPLPTKFLAAGSPTCAEQWDVMTPVDDDFSLWSESYFSPVSAAADCIFPDASSNQDLLDALVTFLDDDEESLF